MPFRLNIRIISTRVWVAASILYSILSYSNCSAQQDYNLKLGPFEFDAIGRAGLEFNSNIATSEFNEEGDVVGFFGVDFRSIWEITEYNDLNVNIGAYYRKYFNNPQLDSHNNFLNLTPDTDIAFRAIIGNLSVQVYDRLTFDIDGADIITPNGNANIEEFGRFDNTFGVNFDWDLNAAQLTLGLGRNDVIPLEDTFDFTRRTQYFISPSVRKTFSEAVVAGVGATWATTDYSDRDFQNNSGTFSVGPFINFIYSEFLDFSAGFRYNFGDFDTPDPNPNSGNNRDFNNNMDSVSFHLTGRHVFNENYIHSLSFNRSINLGLISNFVTSETLEYSFTYSGFRRSDISGAAFWATANDSNANGLSGSLGENYDRFGFRVGLGYALSRRTNFDADYTYSDKDSDVRGRSYGRSVARISVSYDF